MPDAKGNQTASDRVDKIVDELLLHNPPKADRIRLLKELIACGDELPEEHFEAALKRLMERLLD